MYVMLEKSLGTGTFGAFIVCKHLGADDLGWCSSI